MARVSALESGGLFREDLRKLIHSLGQLQGQFRSEVRRQQRQVGRLQARLRRAEEAATKQARQIELLQETVEALVASSSPDPTV